MHKKQALKRLPSGRNGIYRDHAGFGLYKYQKEELKKRARAKGWSVSYFLNYLLWKDWLIEQEATISKRKDRR